MLAGCVIFFSVFISVSISVSIGAARALGAILGRVGSGVVLVDRRRRCGPVVNRRALSAGLDPSPEAVVDRLERSRLRRALRRRRRELPAALRLRASQTLARQIAKSPWFRRSGRIAAYLPSEGEIDLSPLIDIARKRGKRIYLPIMRGRKIHFLPFDPHTRLAPNRFSILEPLVPLYRSIHPLFLDLALLPAVAFDLRGNRLGRGGGYYDRRFEAKRRFRFLRGPKLVGTGYAFQQQPSVSSAPWDIPLDAIASEEAFTPIPRRHAALS